MSFLFKKRSEEQELMDQPDLPKDTLQQALDDISKVNKILGGNQITVNTVKRLIARQPDKKRWHIVDVGCGDGEILRLLSKKLSTNNCDIKLTGIELNSETILLAKNKSAEFDNIHYIQRDIINDSIDDLRGDIVLCTLTLHHIAGGNIPDFLQSMLFMGPQGVVINDLQRSKLAYGLFVIFSRIFRLGAVARNDGLISIQRGFSREELFALSTNFKLRTHSIKWKWAFRYLWVIQ